MHTGHDTKDDGENTPQPQPPTSDRLQLEVALLAAATPRADEAPRAKAATSLALVAISDPDIREYIKQCLRSQPRFGIVEAHSPESPFDIARRLAVDLLITDASIIHERSANLHGIRVLFTSVETPAELSASDETYVAFLLQPFNARRLLDAVEHLMA